MIADDRIAIFILPKHNCMKKFFLLIISFLSIYFSISQTISKSDYTRAASFLPQNLNNKKVFNINMPVAWAGDSSGLAYITQNKEGKQFMRIDHISMQQGPLFDHERLARLLTDSLRMPVKPSNLPFNTVNYTDRNKVTFTAGGKTYTLDLTTYQLSLQYRDETNRMEIKSPDGKWVAYAKDHNLYIRSAATGEIKQLSKGGFKNYEYASYYGWGELIEGENCERPPQMDTNLYL
jgi:dipeptidyl-peptidase-4